MKKCKRAGYRNVFLLLHRKNTEFLRFLKPNTPDGLATLKCLTASQHVQPVVLYLDHLRTAHQL